MRPGGLDKLVAIVGDVVVDNPSGGQTSTPTTLLENEPASIRQVTADERLRGGVQAAEASHRIGLWYRPEITVGHRVTYADPHAGRTRTFEIVTVNNVEERGVELELEVVERVS